MKALIYSLFCFFLSLFALGALQAQTVSKGVFMAGGTAGFNVIRSGGDSDVYFQLIPTLGAFVANDLAVGGNLSVFLSDNLTQFGFGPFVRYYFVPNIFAQGGFGFNSSKVRNFDGDTSLYATLSAGYSIFLNRSVALEPVLNFNFAENQNLFGVNVGFQVFLNR